MTPEDSIIQKIRKIFVNMNGDGAWQIFRDDNSSFIFSFGGLYGVMIGTDYSEDVNENFAKIRLYKESYCISNGKLTRQGPCTDQYLVLGLPYDNEEYEESFLAICYDFVYPGIDGERRRSISENPFKWWSKWKKLVGNAEYDTRAYPVLGELITLNILTDAGLCPVWEGPNSGIVDIRCDSVDYEVKSTVARYSDEITLSSQLQLKKREGRDLHLMYLCFSESSAGISIDDFVKHLISKGFDPSYLEECLSRLGLSRGVNARQIRYEPLNICDFLIDENFPKIVPESFKNNRLPKGIAKITYTVNISGLNYIPIDYKI